jgi:hypothetical protein
MAHYGSACPVSVRFERCDEYGRSTPGRPLAVISGPAIFRGMTIEHDSRARDRRRITMRASMILTISTGACMSWRAETRPLPAPLDGRTLPQIRVFTKTRETLTVYEARLVGDSIVGLSHPRNDESASHVAIATSNVVEVSYLATDGWKTLYSTVGVFAIVLATLTLAAVIACSSFAY